MEVKSGCSRKAFCSAALLAWAPRFNIHQLCMCVWVKQLLAKASHGGVKGGDDKAVFHILSLPLYLNIAAPACVFPLSKRDSLFCSCCTLFSVIIPTVGHRQSNWNFYKRQSNTSHNLLPVFTFTPQTILGTIPSVFKDSAIPPLVLPLGQTLHS